MYRPLTVACARQVNEAAEVIYDLVDPTANLIFGAVVDPRLGQEVSITLIATGFGTGTPVAAAPTAAERLAPAEPAQAERCVNLEPELQRGMCKRMQSLISPVAGADAWTLKFFLSDWYRVTDLHMDMHLQKPKVSATVQTLENPTFWLAGPRRGRRPAAASRCQRSCASGGQRSEALRRLSAEGRLGGAWPVGAPAE